MQRILPRMVPGMGCIFALLEKAIKLLVAKTLRRVPGRTRPGPKYHVKLHPNMAYKG